MKFLIMSVTAGQGHHRCAMAVSDALTALGHECEIMDVYKHILPLLGETIDKGYLLSTKYLPEVYGKVYKIADDRAFGSGITKETQRLVYKRVAEYIEEKKPDAVIATHVFPSILLTYAEKKGKLAHVPSVGIVTDFTVHPYWQESALDAYVVPSSLLTFQCKEKGIPEEKVFPLGIPISAEFSEKLSKSEARARLGIPDKNTVLVMTGSMGYGNVPRLIETIDRLELDFQIIAVCGSNKKNYAELSGAKFSHNVFLHGFTDKVSLMMDAADFIVTKPGGLSVSEALAKRLPMILVNPIPGQETRNLEFLLNSGIALAVSDTFKIDEAVYTLYSDKSRFEGENTPLVRFGHPDAAKKTAELAIKLAKNKEGVKSNEN